MIVAALRRTFCVVAFFLGLGAGCSAIRALLPPPDIAQVSAKLEHFAAHHDDYDTLLIGSSRIYYQLIPALFDRLTAEAGQPTRTFNAGIPGMRPPEDGYFLDQLLRTPPRHLRWVFIELASIRLNIGDEKKATLRAQYWHDWKRLKILWRFTVVQGAEKKRSWKRVLEDLHEPLGEFFDHLELFARQQSSLGRSAIFTPRLVSRPAQKLEQPGVAFLGENLDGWMPTGRSDSMTPENRRVYLQELAERRRKSAVQTFADPVSQDALAAMIEKIERLGATVVLIVPPTTNKKNFYPRSPSARTIVLDFCDLEKFPELYELHHRLDTDHLNTDGAFVFTRLFVRTWLEALQQQR